MLPTMWAIATDFPLPRFSDTTARWGFRFFPRSIQIVPKGSIYTLRFVCDIARRCRNCLGLETVTSEIYASPPESALFLASMDNISERTSIHRVETSSAFNSTLNSQQACLWSL